MSGVSMCRVVYVGGRDGALWLPAGGIRASQGTFSSFCQFCVVQAKSSLMKADRN